MTHRIRTSQFVVSCAVVLYAFALISLQQIRDPQAAWVQAAARHPQIRSGLIAVQVAGGLAVIAGIAGFLLVTTAMIRGGDRCAGASTRLMFPLKVLFCSRSDKLGARPEQQLALNFLQVVHDRWRQRDQCILVEERADDLVPALAQMCIKSLAIDLRDTLSRDTQHQVVVRGRLLNGDRLVKGEDAKELLDLHDVANKIVHGTPRSVLIEDNILWLHFTNSIPTDGWTDVWFSGTQLLEELGQRLFKHRSDIAEIRERAIGQILDRLGEERFLPRFSTN